MANFFKAKREKKPTGEMLTLNISRLDQNGCGVAQQGKKPIFIEGALPNENVTVQIVEQKNKYARAKLINVVDANEHRITPECEHFYQCGGCNLQHLQYEQQISYKESKVKQLFSREGITDVLPWHAAILSPAWHYRRKARIGVQYNKRGEVTVGFRRKESNQLTPIKKCPVLVGEFSEIFIELKKTLSQLSGKNAVGHVEIISANQNIVVVRQLIKMTEKDRSFWLAFAEKNSCVVYIDSGKSVLALSSVLPIFYSIDKLCDIEFNVNDFIQVNHEVNCAMIAQAMSWLTLTSDDIVLDLFCGLGNFSLPIALQVNKVAGVEGVTSMVERAQKNAALNNIKNCHFYQADLNNDWQSKAWSDEKYTKALIDPARAGAYEALQQLAAFSISTLLYVSCDPVSLARDSKLLLSQGYKIKKIAIMDMFSQTKHVETMVMFEK